VPDAKLARHRWVVLGIGVSSQAAFACAFLGIPAVGAALRATYGLTNGQLGIVLASLSLGIALTEVLWGMLTDRLGERPVLVGGLLLTAACLALLALVATPVNGHVPVPLLAAGLLAVGAVGGSVNGSSGRAVMGWFLPNERGLAMSIRQTAVPVGGAIGAALLPLVAVHAGFQAVFGVLAFFCVGAAVAAMVWLRDAPGRRQGNEPELRNSGQSPLRNLGVWRVALASGLLTCPQFAVVSFAAVYWHDAKHLSLGIAGGLLVVVQLGGAILRILCGRWTDHHGSRLALLKRIGWVTAATLGVSALLAHEPVLGVAISLVVAGVLATCWHGVGYTEIAEMAGAERSGTALGLENTTVFVGAFLTPLLIPVLLAALSWPGVWVVVAACPAAAALLLPSPAPMPTRPVLAQ
jgi:sugar phosphate permease